MEKTKKSDIGFEIERKFLVKGEFKSLSSKRINIKQGYLCSHPERTVRVRISDDKGFLTIKGKSDESGTTRLEWEKQIPLSEAEALFELCEPGAITKTRFLVEHLGNTFEVDEFYGENKGLVLAEIEMSDINNSIDFPDWLGDEVTNQNQYYNSSLIKNPFIQWQ